MTGSSFRGTVSSIEVKSTCSNSPSPLQVRGCMGAIGGAASNLWQRPHFLMRLQRSRGHSWPPELLLHQRGGAALALVCRLTVATVHCRTAVPLRHHKLKDGLLGRPDMGLAIQEAVLEEQLLLGLNIGSGSFLIENRQEGFFEGFPGSPKCFTTW